jgi:hypothetical protein
VIRARIFRDGPGVWSFRVLDKYGDPMVLGHADTWDEARDAAVGELQIFAGLPTPTPTPPLISPAATERSWLARALLGTAR